MGREWGAEASPTASGKETRMQRLASRNFFEERDNIVLQALSVQEEGAGRRALWDTETPLDRQRRLDKTKKTPITHFRTAAPSWG